MTALFLGVLLFATGQSAPAIDFKKDVAPILQQNCVRCHFAGNLVLTSREFVMTHDFIVPGKPDESRLLTSLDIIPMPGSNGLNDTDRKVLAQWIREGAVWPAEVSLSAPQKEPVKTAAPSSELENVKQIRERIEANHSNKEPKAYSVRVPNTTVGYDMVPIAAGQFQMGSKDKPDEQPPHTVSVDAFWMQAHEVTWDEYRLFMFANQAGEIAKKDETVDAVSRPTRPYVEMSFGMGINGFPAISMTQHAANKYAEWLSAKTGEFYRLPTEAEWEYACRAGSTAPDTAQLKDYAWFSADSGGKYQKVETKKPNAWGLYDMLGNVMEWTLDAYAPYQAGAESNPWVKAKAPYPFSVRGGSWNDAADQVTCTARVASDPSWKQQDPQLPKSIWYETDAQWLGFRLVSPVKLPPAEEMFKYWNNGVEHDEQ